jgi:osmotically-inducible protein OsmY
MKTGLIILAGALAAAACTNSDTGSAKDRNAVAGRAANAPVVADRTKEADNTGLNERDRQPTTTPLDQGNSTAETDITASIRKGIMADDTLSFNAKNVKVVTVGSKVTLRGPVQTDQARVAIAALAKRTPGVSEVDNQLEVAN